MNIFEMASQNIDNLKRDYSILEGRCKNQNDLEVMRGFASLIEDTWMISINMRPFILNSFLISGVYLNIYKLKKETKKQLEEVKQKVSVEQTIKMHSKDYYQPRITFDRTFEDGEKFKYGALTIGGIGLQKYGECCVVFNREQSKEFLSLAFIKEESLHYIEENHVSIQKLRQEVADREHVHLLAALKHENDILRISGEEWPSLICCDNCYIETVTTDHILDEHIESVRVNKKYYDFIKNLLYRDFISEISDSERVLLYTFLNMQKLLEKRGIRLEVVGK